MGKVSVVLAFLLLSVFASQAQASSERIREIEDIERADFISLRSAGLDIWMHNLDDARIQIRSARDLNLIRAKNLGARAIKTKGASTRASYPELPSGRKSYRFWEDYRKEMIALSRNYPELVRLRHIGETHEKKGIIGLEIARNVWRNDGRPVFVQHGLLHAREFPSGEMPLEFAYQLLENSDTERIDNILRRTRIFIFPVVNVDGFVASRGALAKYSEYKSKRFISGNNHYRRKNCRRPQTMKHLPCAAIPNYYAGVDLNRNYGYYWGGAGADMDSASEIYRGPAPFSEPESRAMKNFLRSIQPETVVSHHTYWEDGLWIRPPHFVDSVIFPNKATPDEPELAAFAASLAQATGWLSRKVTFLYPVTGSSAEWSYLAQGSRVSTSEIKGGDFHDNFSRMVRGGYPGFSEAMLRAAERTLASKTRIYGQAPPGARLRLEKSFSVPNCAGYSATNSCKRPFRSTPESLYSEITVPASGSYSWHVLPSSRPLEQGESWTMTCTSSLSQSMEIAITRGEEREIDWQNCGSSQENPLAIQEPYKSRVGEKHVLRVEAKDALWDLDEDGLFDDASGDVVSHIFTSPGTKTVSVTDGSSQASRVIDIAPIEPAKLSVRTWVRKLPSHPYFGYSWDLVFKASGAPGNEFFWDLDGDGFFDDASGGVISRGLIERRSRGKFQRTQIRVKSTSASGSTSKTIKLRLRKRGQKST